MSAGLQSLLLIKFAKARTRTIEEAKRQFQRYVEGDKDAIHPSLRLPVFRINITDGGKSAYDAVKQEYLNTTSIDGKEICLQALGSVQSAELVNDFMDFQFSEEVAVQDIHSGSIALAANPKARMALWAYIKDHWEGVHKKLSTNSVIINRYFKSTLQQFASHQVEQDIANFFENKDTKGFDRGLVQVSDTVRGNANYKERDEQLILEWLKAHDYVPR